MLQISMNAQLATVAAVHMHTATTLKEAFIVHATTDLLETDSPVTVGLSSRYIMVNFSSLTRSIDKLKTLFTRLPLSRTLGEIVFFP